MKTKLSIKKQLLQAVITPDQFDFWSRELGSTAAWSRCIARVVEKKIQANNTVSLTLKPNKNFAGFLPGQHVNVSALIKGVRITRSYSLSNIPNAKGLVEITVRQEPNGVMSSWLNNEASVGSTLELGAIFGDMTFATPPTQPVLLLAAGSGITPMMSLLRQAAQEYPALPVTLLYWDKAQADFCFADELDQLASTHAQITVHKISTRESLPTGSLTGRIELAQVKQCVNDLAERSVFVCGGNDFVAAARDALEAEVSSLQTESFSAPTTLAPSGEAKRFEITLTESDRRITVSNKDNLLKQLEAQGVAVESGCRMGICNTCTCQKIAGSNQDISNNEINSESRTAIRLCVSRATSDMQLAL